MGFHHDDALDGLTALGILKGNLAIFFNNYNPREPLMIYFQSIGELLFGPTRLGASSMPALFGTVEVALAWLMASSMFGRRIGLLTAGFTAVSFWHMFVSRLSERAISQPLVEMLCLYFFWRTLNKRRWLDAILAGVFLGLALYTYTAARAVPILLLAVVLWQLAAAPGFFRRSMGQMLVAAAVGVLVFLPLGLHFLHHPGDFWGRSLEVNVIAPEQYTASGGAGGVQTAIVNTLGMFSIRGDGTWKYNLSGQPVFDWPMSALFYAGLLVALAGAILYLRSTRSDRGAADPNAFALLWLAAMLVPGFVSSESPHFLRTIGIVPAVFMMPALAADWLVRRWRWALPLAGALIIGEGAETYVHYFNVWARTSEAYYANHGDVADAAEYLKTLPADTRILFSTEYPNHPTVLYLAPEVFPRVRWFDGRSSMVFPPAGQRFVYVFPVNYRPLWTNLSTYFQPSQLLHEGLDPSGRPAYDVYASDAPPQSAQPLQPLKANLAGLAQVTGAAVPSTIPAGQTLSLLEYWTVTKATTPGLRAFAHLVDAQGHLWAQADNLGFYSEGWQVGDTGINRQALTVPATAPPIPMKVQFGVYRPSDGQRLSFLDANGIPAGTEITLGSVQVQAAPAPASEPIPHALNQTLAPGLTLAGYEIGAPAVQAGATLPVTLYWRLSGPATAIPSIELPGVQTRDQGLSNVLPADHWPTSGVIQDRHDVQVAPTAHGGEVAVQVGGVKLGQIAVTEPKRDFTLPSMQRRIDLPVGDFATLAGYNVSQAAAGQTLHLTLVWQARASTPTSYKVFAHVLDGQNHVVAQKDDIPQAGAMPTTYWIPGQVITDAYDIPLPPTLPASLQLEVGMYQPDSGKRLTVGSGDHFLAPLG